MEKHLVYIRKTTGLKTGASSYPASAADMEIE